nr:diguanylate cyclase [Chromobacterium sp. ASV5]
MTQGPAVHPGQRVHLAKEIDRIGHMLVNRWERPLAAHLLSLVSRLEAQLRAADVSDFLNEIHTLARLLQGWLQQAEGLLPSERERYGQLRHLLGVVSQVGMMQRSADPDAETAAPAGAAHPAALAKLYLWLPEGLEADALSRQLACFGFDVRIVRQAAGLAQEIQRAQPAAVVVYSDFSEHDPVLGLAQVLNHDSPLIFTSPRRDFATRLQAVRAGASGFLDWPLQAYQLVDLLSFGDLGERREPLRILIVEDMQSLAELYSRVLSEQGVEALSETRPEQVPALIEQFKPDLILMDMYMPQCNGMELAKIIRQQRLLDGIPIVFLSVEKRQAVQLDALTLGIDGFLTKPVEPEELIVTVINRARRYRKLRSYIVNDSLTGLLNHSHLHGELESALQRARRDGKPLSLAMLDLDHFKTINDSYGHQAGDDVLVNLARFLKERLRRGDLIGRYGGEEFAIALIDTSAEQAWRIMDKLRQDFSLVEQHAADALFQQTFSAGICASGDADDAATLIRQADEALYRAKALGRNRVERADAPTTTPPPAEGGV